MTITVTPIAEQVQTLIDQLNNEFRVNSIESGHSSFYQLALYPGGRKYYRIVAALVDSKDTNVLECRSRSCYAFIDGEGNIYKSASWKTPAKGIRATIDQVLSGSVKADPYGSWLYLR